MSNRNRANRPRGTASRPAPVGSRPVPARGRPVAARASQAPARGGTTLAGWPRGFVLAAVAMLSAVAVFSVRVQTAAGEPESSVDAALSAEVAFGHIHGLALDPHSGALYAATHTGLYRIDGEHTAVRVSKETPDLMGFTMYGHGRFLASGHPDTHAGGPANLGLIESTDGGVTWREMSLSGAADFHGLQAAHDAVYGYNSVEGTFMVSTDLRTWERRSTVALGSFAVSPADPQRILAVGREGLQQSRDGGRTWAGLAGAPPVGLLAWEQEAEVWATGFDGAVWHSADGGDTWHNPGRLPAQPQAIAVHGVTAFAALTGDQIVASDDGGVTWIPIYAPA